MVWQHAMIWCQSIRHPCGIWNVRRWDSGGDTPALRPPHQRNARPIPLHPKGPGRCQANTTETAATRPCRTVRSVGRLFLPLLLEASQQSADVAFAVRCMMAANAFANQGSQFRRILLQIQILRLTESAAQCVANNLAGVIVEAAFDLLLNDRLQFSRQRNIHYAKNNAMSTNSNACYQRTRLGRGCNNG